MKAKLTGPDGTIETLPLDWSGSQDGTYQTQVTAATKEGTYQLEVEASRATEKLGTYKAAFQVKDRPVEFYDAALDAGNLRSIATQTGGRYYPLANLADIPEDAVYVDTETSFVEQKELWDVPILFMMLCALLGRRVGLEEEEGAWHETAFLPLPGPLSAAVSRRWLGGFQRSDHPGSREAPTSTRRSSRNGERQRGTLL